MKGTRQETSPFVPKPRSGALKFLADLADYVRLGTEALNEMLAGLQEAVAPEEVEAPAPVSQFGFMSGGEFFAVREVTSDDADRLQTFLQDGLSDESRARRFLTPVPTVRPHVADQLADRDGHRRVGLVATIENDESGEEIVALAEYALTNDGTPPEVAIAVADEFQGRGVGVSLLRALATVSMASGYRTWSAEMLSDNRGIFALLSKVGTLRKLGESQGVTYVEVDLTADKVFAAT